MESKVEILHIDWDGPFSLQQLKSLCDARTDVGVYQIYGAHPIYGADVLLYIGKTEEQTFGVRIEQENWGRNSDEANVKIYIGRLAGSETPDAMQWKREIGLAEQLLIYAHSPARNSKNLQTIREDGLKNLHIMNWGNHRDLLPEVSGARWTDKYDEMPNYEVYGDHEK